MINRIIASYVLFSCLLAIFLYNSGVVQPIHLSTYFQAFLINTNRDLANFKIAIPNISFRFDVQGVKMYLESENIFSAFVQFVTGFYSFLNFLINILNFLITFINTLISVLEFAFLFIKNLIIFRDSVVA